MLFYRMHLYQSIRTNLRVFIFLNPPQYHTYYTYSYHIKFYLWGIYNWPSNYMSLNCTSKLIQGSFSLINISENSLEIFKSFPGDSEGKESDCRVGDLGLIPELERTPGEGNGYPYQSSCLENSMDRGDWWAAVLGVTKSWTWLSGWHFLFIYFLEIFNNLKKYWAQTD